MQYVPKNQPGTFAWDTFNARHEYLEDTSLLIQQVTESLKVTHNTCPKEDTIVYLKQPRYVEFFGEIFELQGLVALPPVLTVTVDRYNDGIEDFEPVDITEPVNQRMFKYKNFADWRARKTRVKLCNRCPYTDTCPWGSHGRPQNQNTHTTQRSNAHGECTS